MNLTDLKIKEAHEGLVEKKFSSEELVKACLEVALARNSDLNAFITIDEAGALKQAKSVDAKIAKGEKLPVLAGIPCGVKDIINTKGLRTTCASPILRDFVPPYDATVVSKLRENDAVIVGKTNMDEYGCGGSTEHSCFGVTKNPYDTSRVAGGSSGGSACALATGMCLFSLGTDTGGSIRQPASFCGLYGLKVTYGRVSRSGVTAYASSFDTIGSFCRSAEDIAFVMNAIAGHDAKDGTTKDVEVPDYTEFLKGDVKGLKIGLPKEYFGDGVDNEVSESVKKYAAKFEKAGAKVVEVSLPMTKYAIAAYYVLAPCELSANLERFDGIRYGKKPSGSPEDLVDFYFKSRGAGFGQEVKRRIMIGTYALSAGYYDAYYKKAQKVRTKIIQDFDRVFEEVDVLIAPVSPFTAFEIGKMADDPLAMYMADALTIPINAAGLPSIACPTENDSKGLPIGLQIIGPQFEEGRLLRVANALAALK